MSNKLKNTVLDFSDKLNRFSTTSKRETGEKISEDRGAARRAVAVGGLSVITKILEVAANGSLYGFFPKFLVGVSGATNVYLVADAAASVAETAYNVRKYNKKINSVNKFLNTINKDDVDLYSNSIDKRNEAKKALEKGLEGDAFKAEYAKILRQIFSDFETAPRFDLVRDAIKEQGLTDADVNKIKLEVKENGFVKSNTVAEISKRNGGKIGKVLELIACDDFADRIVDINRDETSKFKSASHIKGCLALTNKQQTQKKVKLTPEQKFVMENSNMSEAEFVEWLKYNDSLIQAGEFDELNERQNNIIEKVKANNPKLAPSINDKLEGKYEIFADTSNSANKKELKKHYKQAKKGMKGIKSDIKKAAKQTAEYQLTSWKRNLFPITKAIGTPIKALVNKVQDKLYYRGDLYKAHRSLTKLEKTTKLKHADVYCENGTGFRKIREDYRKAGVQDFIVKHNYISENKVPNSFVCGYIQDENYFKATKQTTIEACMAIQTELYSKEVVGKNGKVYTATCYLDDPVVIQVNGQNFDGKENLPLLTINVDQRQVLNATVSSILWDLSKDENFQSKVNNITFTAGGRTRTIYVPQIKEDIASLEIAGTELFETHTHCARMLANITRDEPFVRVYREGGLPKLLEGEKVNVLDGKDESISPDAEKPQIEKENKPGMTYKLPAEEVEKKKSPARKKNNKPNDKELEILAQKDDELNLLLLKRDLINLQKKKNARLDYASKQFDLLEELSYSKLDEAKQLESLEREALINKNDDLKLKIEEKLKEVAGKIGFTQEKVNNLKVETEALSSFIAQIEKDLNENKIENISEVRANINEYKYIIESYYRENLQNDFVYIKNEKTGKTSNLYSRLNGELRKEYSKTITKPRTQKEAELNKQLEQVNAAINKRKKQTQNNQ